MILKTCCLSLLVALLPFSTVTASDQKSAESQRAAIAPSPENAVVRFPIRSFDVQGNTILSSSEISLLLNPFAGEEKDFGDVQQALEALENAYSRKGYNSVSVYLPEQELKNGIVILKVVEAKISEITVEGNRFFSKENIERSFPLLIRGSFPQIHEISKNLRAANENPAKKITMKLSQGTKEDEIVANLKVVDEQYWKAGFTLDNSGSKQTGDYRLGLLLQHFNLHDRDHVATIHYTTSPDHADAVNSVSASYRLPLYSLGDTIDIFAGYSDVDSGSFNLTTSSFSYNAGNINGKGVISGVRYNYTLKRYGEFAQKLVAGMDYRYYDNSSDFAVAIANGGAFSGTSASKLVLHPLSITYSGSYSMDRTEIGLFAGGVYNIPWGDHGDRGDFPEGTAADYFLLRYGMNFSHAFPSDFQMRLSFNGQYAPRTLVAYEQLGLGGASAGRGYEDRAAAGDNGYSGTAELYSPDLARLLPVSDIQFRLIGFYDDGYVHAAKSLNGDDQGVRAASAGGGVRFSVSKYFTASVDWGVVLNSVATSSRGDNKVHFKFSFIY